MIDDDEGWAIGQLADAAGVTVRALHHYDRIGLLRPSHRTPAGHRRYSDDDVRRLYEIAALRQLGLALAEIADVLDRDDDALLAQTMDRQLHRVGDQLETLTRLRRQLEYLTGRSARGQAPDTHDLMTTTELTTMTFSFDQIVSRTGDDGTTALADGARRAKTDDVIVALGDLDELQANLGVVVDQPETTRPLADALRHIMNDLFDVGSDVARPDDDSTIMTADHVDWVERQIHEHASGLHDVALPILQTGGPVSSRLHVARTVCRRAERSTVAAATAADDHAIRYLNRLSDLLFVMARAFATSTESARRTWTPGPPLADTTESARAPAEDHR